MEKKQFSQLSLISQVSESPSEFHGRLPLMNPGEMFAVTLTAVGTAEVGPLYVTARAPGATATPRSDEQLSSQVLALLGGFLVAGIAALAFSLFSSYRTAKLSDSIAQIENLGEVSKRIEKTEDDLATRLERHRKEFERETERERQGKPNTEQIVFAVFNRSGLSHHFHELAIGNGEVTYWKSVLFLLHAFLVDEMNRGNYIAAAEAIVELPDMVPSSRGFGLYLLGKMVQFRGNSERAIHWFEQCRTAAPLMHAHLMTQDPAYDLSKMRDHLLQHGLSTLFPNTDREL